MDDVGFITFTTEEPVTESSKWVITDGDYGEYRPQFGGGVQFNAPYWPSVTQMHIYSQSGDLIPVDFEDFYSLLDTKNTGSVKLSNNYSFYAHVTNFSITNVSYSSSDSQSIFVDLDFLNHSSPNFNLDVGTAGILENVEFHTFETQTTELIDPSATNLGGRYGAYIPERTSNTRWVISCSIDYSASMNTATPGLPYDLDVTLQLYTGSWPLFPTGGLVAETTQNLTSAGSTGKLKIETVYGNHTNQTFGYEDLFRMAVKVDYNDAFNNLDITAYSMSIFTTGSTSLGIKIPVVTFTGSVGYNNYPIATEISTIVPTYFGPNILAFNLAKDCQPTLNNYIDARKSSFLMDVDYTTDSITPVNSASLYTQSAERASTPDSNYTILRSITPRYLGSKSTSDNYNVWGNKDRGTYGKLPTIELRNAFFGYFDTLRDPYPNINDAINPNITYLIDENGNAIPPSLEGIGLFNLENTFIEGETATLSIDSGSKELKELNSDIPLLKVGKYVTPIMYTQTSSIGYSDIIPLSGSKRISRYDNNDSNSFSNYPFTVQGKVSVGVNSATNLDININPSEDHSSGSFATDSIYSASGAGLGQIEFPIDNNGPQGAGSGQPLSDSQFVSVEVTPVTSYIRESGTIEAEMKLILQKSTNGGSTWTNIPPTLEDITLTVIKGTQKIELGSVARGEDDIIRFITGRLTKNRKRKRKKYGLNSKDRRIGSESPVVNNENEIEVVIENYAIDRLLRRRNVFRTDSERDQITSLNWTFTANSGNQEFNQKDKLRWRFKGFTRGNSNVFSPNGERIECKIQNQNSLSHLFATDNQGNTPFWVYTGSAGVGNSNILDKSILVMSSSNINEAYGNEFAQGDLPYTPSTSEFFPGGNEPTGTQFDKIVNTLKLQPGDEIRFANNENYTYQILEVTPPPQNIEEGKGRLKIKLNGEVPNFIDKNFFLVRRYIENPNSILLGVPYPYSTPPSASTSAGIMFPEYPVPKLQASASLIITELIDKGVIR